MNRFQVGSNVACNFNLRRCNKEPNVQHSGGDGLCVEFGLKRVNVSSALPSPVTTSKQPVRSAI